MKVCAKKVLSIALAIVMVFGLSTVAFAYDRQEKTVATGGTEVTVYKGTQNSNDTGNYLADPGDYLAFNRYETAKTLVSQSNITSSTNFVKTETPDSYVCHGGVEGVSWEGNTLTLNNASGTVITIEGPEIDVTALNTYNDKLSTVIDITMPNLTYYKQFDLFNMGGGAGAPHTKDNATEQDVIYVNLVGENNFNNIRLSGNVKVVFTGTGSLTLDAVKDWNYDDYSEPDFDALSNPCAYAVSSYPTIGHNGSLKGTDLIESSMGNGRSRTITEEYAFALPEIVLDGIEITEGGEVFNTAQVKGEDYFTFVGETALTDESRVVEAPEGLTNSYALMYKGAKYNLVYNAEKTAFYAAVSVGMGKNATTTYYDVTADIKAWEPWESFIGTEGTPAAKVVIGTALDVVRSEQALIANSKNVDCDKYNINGYNYFKLRDIAALLNGTGSQFSVSFDADKQIVYAKTGEAYEAVGGELTVGEDQSATCVASSWTFNVDGKEVAVSAYNIGGNNYFKLRDLGEALGFNVDYIQETNTAVITTDAAEKTLLQAIVIEKPMMQPATNCATSEKYNALYKGGNAVEGVKAIIAAGKCFINDFAIPATGDELPEDGYQVDGSAWMTKSEDGWKVGRTNYTDYIEAAAATLDNLNAGLEIRLYDTDGDGYADMIEADYLEAVIVNKIVKNEDGTYSIYRAEIDSETEKAFDGQHFTATSGEVIKAENFDTTIKEGDMGLFWYAPDGWHMMRAVEANGVLIDGQDHGAYNIGGTEYQDAMKFSRDNIIISNRCGELTNAHKYFGFNNNNEGLKVSLWLVPTTDPTQINGAPAGYTDENAAEFLARAITIAKEKLEAGKATAPQEAYDEMNAAIVRAEGVLESGASNELCDYQIYLLYLHLHGSGDDIGAKFAGYDFVGYDNQVG